MGSLRAEGARRADARVDKWAARTSGRSGAARLNDAAELRHIRVQMASSFQQIQPVSPRSFLSSDGTADGRDAPLPFKFQPGAVTSGRTTKKRREREGEREREKRILSAVMSKASIFTEQLGVSSQRSDVKIHYGSATANCFKVKVTDLTALYFQ